MNSDLFKFELSIINNQVVKQLVIDILDKKVSDDMLLMKSSSSGKYHPTDNGAPESILVHSKRVVRILGYILIHPSVRADISDIEHDLMISAGILHDCCKYGPGTITSDCTLNYHPILVSLLYPYEESSMNTTQEGFYFKEIVRLISTHHGPWNRSNDNDIVLPLISDNLQWYLHLSDYLASRRIMNIDVKDESILNELKY